jgi:hypothetical protein
MDIRNKGRNIPQATQYALRRAADQRCHPDIRSQVLKGFNEELINTGGITMGMVDQLSLPMGIFGSTYNALFVAAWTTIAARDQFKFVLAVARKQDIDGHDKRLAKFRCYLIEERKVKHQLMQRKVRAKGVRAQTGQWTLTA